MPTTAGPNSFCSIFQIFWKIAISKNKHRTTILTRSTPTNVKKWRRFLYSDLIFKRQRLAEKLLPTGGRQADDNFNELNFALQR